MEQKETNIADILKAAHIENGFSMWSPICGWCIYLGIDDENHIHVQTAEGSQIKFLEDGRYFDDGEPLLYPSKDNQDWNVIYEEYYKFEPFDKVLIKNNENDTWKIGIYVTPSDDVVGRYSVFVLEGTAGYQKCCYCIPYEGNESLHGVI